MSDALLFLPVAHALLRLLFLGQMNGECSMDLFRFICCIWALWIGSAWSWALLVLWPGWWDRPSDAVRWPKPVGGTLGALPSCAGFSCQSPSRIIRIKSKMRWEERSCQAGVQCHGCDEQRAKWLLLIHTKGFPPLLFGRIKELEGMSINPPRVCLHWTPSELIVLNILSYFCAAQQLEGLEMVDHIIWHFLHIFLISHSGKLNWGKPFHVQWELKVFRIYPSLGNPRNSPQEVADSSVSFHSIIGLFCSVLSKRKFFNNYK